MVTAEPFRFSLIKDINLVSNSEALIPMGRGSVPQQRLMAKGNSDLIIIQPAVPLRPIFIEGIRKNKFKNSNLIQVPSGPGSEIIDLPLNELGFSIKNMERDDDLGVLASQRDDWWIPAPWNGSQWFHQARWGGGSQETLRLRSSLLNEDHQYFQWEMGQIKGPDPQFKDLGLKLTHSEENLRSLVSLNQQKKKIYFEGEPKGIQNQTQLNLMFQASQNFWSLSPFLRGSLNEFDPIEGGESQNFSTNKFQSTQDGLFGLHFKLSDWDLNNDPEDLYFESMVTSESLRRSYNHEITPSEFQQKEWSFRVLKKIKDPHFVLKSHLESTMTTDWWAQKSEEVQHPLFLNGGIEVSSSENKNLGVLTQLRKWSQAPTPSQRFGDGGLIGESPQLNVEQGVRSSLGVWFKFEGNDDFSTEKETKESKDFKGSLQFYQEKTVNEPILISTSPLTAKTFGIGSVVARGIELKLQKNESHSELSFIYNRQEALNNSEISWQRGQAIPGRPKHSIQLNGEFLFQPWRAGSHYTYLSEDAKDLTGLHFSEPRQELGLFLGYKQKKWEVRLEGKHWLLSGNPKIKSTLPGRAGSDLVQTTLDEEEVNISCEFIL